MTSLVPEVEGWIKLAGAAVAVLMAVLVPVRSWIVEDRRYRAQTLAAMSAASQNAVGGVGPSATVLADSLAMSSLAEAIDRAAAAIDRLAVREGRRSPPIVSALSSSPASSRTAPPPPPAG